MLPCGKQKKSLSLGLENQSCGGTTVQAMDLKAGAVIERIGRPAEVRHLPLGDHCTRQMVFLPGVRPGRADLWIASTDGKAHLFIESAFGWSVSVDGGWVAWNR